jgi:Protein of unknown function (DUF2568)
MNLKSLNLALAFFLELAMLAALAYAGFQIASPLRFVVGIGAPLLAILFWARFMAPKAPTRLIKPAYLIAKFTLFGIATISLALVGQVTLAIIFIVVSVMNQVLPVAWGDEKLSA